MQATKEQKQLIHIKAPTRDIKEEFVQWATGDVKCISCDDLNFEQANRILEKLGVRPFKASWAKFDKNNSKHRRILSMMYQAGWTVYENGREVPDLNCLNDWLHSSKCPINKPLMMMDDVHEMPRLIKAFSGIVKSKWK